MTTVRAVVAHGAGDLRVERRPAPEPGPGEVAVAVRLAALADPAAVAWHAVRRAGDVRGARVLVTGAGPIGCLVVAAARAAGAAEVVATDLYEQPLAVARAVGATATVPADALDV